MNPDFHEVFIAYSKEGTDYVLLCKNEKKYVQNLM